MNGGGGDVPWPSPPVNGGEFLLQLLQKRTPPQQQPLLNPSSAAGGSFSPSPRPPALTHDPAVAALGPTLPFQQFPTSSHDLPYNFPLSILQNPNPSPNWSPLPPPGFNHNHHPHQNPQFSPQFSGDDFRKLGLFNPNNRANSANPQEHNLTFGSFSSEFRNNECSSFRNSHQNVAPGAKIEGLASRGLSNLEAGFQNSLDIDRNSPATSSAFRNHHHQGGIYRSIKPSPQPPPGFSRNPNGNESGQVRELNNLGFASNNHHERERKFPVEQRRDRRDVSDGIGLIDQLDRPGPPPGSNLHSVSASKVEESMSALHSQTAKDGEKIGSWREGKERRDGQGLVNSDDPNKQLIDAVVLEDELDDKNGKKKHHNSRDKDYRSDTRGQYTLGQRMRNLKRQIECRSDIDRLNTPLLAIFESLIPPEEEKAKQKQLLTLLEKLVSKEWPGARLYLYGSCANSFGVSKSDIDVCLAMEDAEINKPEVLLKLAEILESDNLQNVQALTRARVPIVKLFDPVTGISCDICINNILAVVNTKLLRDYAEVDERLRQLAFIVKHWAKSRGVNATYQGTLSSYAYVLMCIHFLQLRRPAILPCLQGMETTYAVTVDNVDCAYFDQVEKLRGFGHRNRESIARLVWAFFNYWAYCHDYASDVISVRTGSVLSKRVKDWTRRIGNDRHLICIEDPLETSHDLGRVVDKFSIKVLREEFERAAEILQYDPNPCVTLFEPYVPS